MNDCIYLGDQIGHGTFQAGLPPAKFHLCLCPRVIADACIVAEHLDGQAPELDATIQRDGKTLQAKFANCGGCPHRSDVNDEQPWRAGELQYITVACLVRDTLSLVPHLPGGISAVAGVPRSGIIPASVLATALKVPLLSIDPTRGLLNIGAGTRERTFDRDGNDGTLLVVDDTLYDGQAMARVRSQCDELKLDAMYCAVYARKPREVDLCYCELPSPHLCEWNLFQNPVMSGQAADKRLRGGLAFDFDGVLCPNPPGPVTSQWLARVPPLHFLPRASAIPLIVTMRLESWRDATETWLAKHGASANRIVMCQCGSEAERDANLVDEIVKTKARPFAESDCAILVESEPWQAELLSDASGKPVLCVGDGKIYY